MVTLIVGLAFRVASAFFPLAGNAPENPDQSTVRLT